MTGVAFLNDASRCDKQLHTKEHTIYNLLFLKHEEVKEIKPRCF